MSLQKIIEEKIAEAIASGEFDNLPGSGKPLDLEDYFKAPEDMRMCFGLLKSNDFIPPEVELLKEIEKLRTDLASCSGAERAAELKSLIQEKSVRLNLLLENFKTRKNR